MKKQKLPKSRNAYVLPMTLGRKSNKFKDRREPKGGARNKQQDYHRLIDE